MEAAIRAIEYYLPEATLSTAELSRDFPEWSVEKIDTKTGIKTRHIARPDECSSDLAVAAARKLFASGICRPSDIDFVLFCTQTPDYFLPTSACLIQDRLEIPTSAGALDFNLGCSGFVYGLGLAKGLIASRQAGKVLLLTAETYSKFIHQRDRSVRTIFGDAGAATLLVAEDSSTPFIGPFVYGTDGRGGENLIVRTGGMRCGRTIETAVDVEDNDGNVRSADNLFMNGAEIFAFTMNVVPRSLETLLRESGKKLEDIDLFIFHQANQYMLQHLRKRLKIPESKFYLSMSDCGNTVSCSIPIALKHALVEEKVRSGALLMLVGFGVGYSWSATLMSWR